MVARSQQDFSAAANRNSVIKYFMKNVSIISAKFPFRNWLKSPAAMWQAFGKVEDKQTTVTDDTCSSFY
jgi:hypothetical protein